MQQPTMHIALELLAAIALVRGKLERVPRVHLALETSWCAAGARDYRLSAEQRVVAICDAGGVLIEALAAEVEELDGMVVVCVWGCGVGCAVG